MIRIILPLLLRKLLCLLINRQKFLNDDVKYWWTLELLRDFAEKDSNGYHRFLWTHHLAYASSYEVDVRFGEERMKESRRLFFSDLMNHLTHMGIKPQEAVHSILEVGCSLGYQLRYVETDLFPEAAELSGVDIDKNAIIKGTAYLRNMGSKIQLICDDMGNLGHTLGDKIYDIILCTGVLMYLEEKEASRVVEEMLRHCRVMVAISGPAYADMDNCYLEHSVIRENDGSFIHNFDALVKKSGGLVFARRWEGSRIVDGHTIYFVFAKRKD